MDRRHIFKLAAIALPTAGLALRPNTLQAQGATIPSILAEIVDNNAWLNNPDAYFKAQWGALTYATLVELFGPPDGNLPEGHAQQLLRTLMPADFAQWRADAAPYRSTPSRARTKTSWPVQ